MIDDEFRLVLIACGQKYVSTVMNVTIENTIVTLLATNTQSRKLKIGENFELFKPHEKTSREKDAKVGLRMYTKFRLQKLVCK